MDLLIGRSIDQIDKIVRSVGRMDSYISGRKKKDGLVDRIDIDPGGLEDQ